jgi:hypothetical protein
MFEILISPSSNKHTNRSKGKKSMDEFIESNGDEYTESQIQKIR